MPLRTHPLPVGLVCSCFRVRGPGGWSRDLDSPNCGGQNFLERSRSRRLGIDTRSVFNEPPWTGHHCEWDVQVGRLQLAHGGEEEAPGRACVTHAGKMTRLLSSGARGLCVRGLRPVPATAEAGKDGLPESHPRLSRIATHIRTSMTCPPNADFLMGLVLPLMLQ